jgi:hypothetical protein
MLVRGARMGLMARFPGSIIARPSTPKLYSYTPGATGPTVADQTPGALVAMGTAPFWNCPETVTLVALGARSRKTTVRSGSTSGETTGPVCWAGAEPEPSSRLPRRKA